MRHLRLATLAPALFLALAASPVCAMHWDTFYWPCRDLVVEVPPAFFEELPVPVGCEVIDCCPGCPGPGPIDWRIVVDERVTRSATLRFEGLGAAALGKLKLGGSARLGKGPAKGQVVVGPGTSTISGFPEAMGERPPVAFVTSALKAAKSKGAGGAGLDADRAAAANDADGGIEILQYMRGYVINQFRVRYFATLCPRPSVQDRIRTNGNTSADSTVILADYRTSAGCQNDLIHRATTSVGIGNALTNAACNTEVSVFSDDNAMSFQPNVTTWTDNPGDLQTVTLAPIITVPLAVWATTTAAVATATNDVANANFLYNQNNVGVQFNATITNVSGNANTVATIDGVNGDCASAGSMSANPAFFTANAVNAYYVSGAFTGVNCGANRNVNFIGTTANIASLPHEIGHAYGLRPSGSGGHVNGLAGFGNENIMFGGGPATRSNFTVGQSFRLDTSTISMLNLNGNRTGPTRDCPPLTSDNVCPALVLDSQPH